jgi:serine/threonine protein phosphatase PrpC
MERRMSTMPETAVNPDRKPHDHEIDVWGVTHVGRVRKENQDNYLIASLHKRLEIHGTSLTDLQPKDSGEDRLAFIAVVADGVGGGEQGEAASRLTVETVMDYIHQSMRCYYGGNARDETFVQELQDAAMQCHSTVLERAEADGARGMATTLTLYLGVWPWTYLLQLGDSRYYVFREGELTQVSRDQTMAQELVDQGVFTRADAERSRFAHVLSSAIGGKSAVPQVTRLKADWRNVHLLCSDGLTRHVTNDRIREVLGSMTSAKQACETLLEEALAGGGTDNVTMVIGRAVPSQD